MVGYTMLRRYLSTGSAPAKPKVPLSLIKELRARTGAPVSSVKSALELHSNDVEECVAYLRRQGVSVALKRGKTRAATEGRIGTAVSPCGTRGSIIELRCETDFVARTPQVQALVSTLAEHALDKNSSNSIEIGEHPAVGDAAAALQEAIQITRVRLLEAPRVSSYVHGDGNIGVLVALSDAGNSDVAQRVAMHVAAAAPTYLSRGDVCADAVAREREALREQAQASGKPPTVVEKIVDGRIDKWYAEVCLEEQEMVVESMDYAGKARKVGKSIDSDVKGCEVVDFERYSIR